MGELPKFTCSDTFVVESIV